ncbi:MAG: hypothetical protein KF729_03785 [Sandaracinaceae bacterium]|nr:hypothetical protein [Sandaracinaceae bacterium]
MRSTGIATLTLFSLACVGCAAVADDLRRAEQSYEAARYENARVWLRDLEGDAPGMDVEMRARYFYLRGMTEYRLGHRADALHYLAVAREIAGDGGAGLRPEWRQLMDRTLSELTPRGMDWRPPDDQAPSEEASSGGEQPRGDT